MLIINGDDFGRDRTATDSCMHCCRQKRITSASIMVFMEDSNRAAKLAINEQIETGLHINLVLPYNGQGVAESLRKTQNSTVAFFHWGPWTQAIYNPFIMKSVASVFNSQLDEYRRLFRKEPAHFNGHKHFHLSLNMIGGKVIPGGSSIRRSFSSFKGDMNLFKCWYRRLIDRWLLKRYVSTDAFFSLDPLSDLPRLTRIVKLAKNNSVELMVHPWIHAQFAFLTGNDFSEMLANVSLGGFAALKSSVKNNIRTSPRHRAWPKSRAGL